MLTVELVPITSWGANLRSRLPTKDWDKLRRRQYTLANYCCQICKGKGPRHPVECHEIWHYDDESHVQTLKGLIALCPACHGVKHLGRSYAVGLADVAIAHLRDVNGWDVERAECYIEGVFIQHAQRSQHEWTLNLEWLSTVGVEIPSPGP